MSSFYSDDPVRDAENWIAAQESKMELLPKCCCCKEPIQQEKAVCVGGYYYCKDCELDAWDEVRENYLEAVTEE